METATTYRITETLIMNDFKVPTRSPEAPEVQAEGEDQPARGSEGAR